MTSQTSGTFASILWILTALCACCTDVRAQPDPPPDLPGNTRAASPWPPPKASDIVFVVSEGPGLDRLVGRSTLVIPFEVTRYLGPTNSDGTLKNAQALVQRGLLSDYAILDIPAYDVEYTGDPNNPNRPPQRDRLSFNGEPVESFRLPSHPWLRGEGQKWELHKNRLLIPIEKVRFPSQPGEGGTAPTPAQNTVTIYVDELEGDWVVQIDWISLSLKATSPVILVHGNSSDGGFFVRQGFTWGLSQKKVLWNNSIHFSPNQTTMEANADALADLVPQLAKEFGVDSVHLVAHSKGGLDARAMLGTHYSGMESTVKVLSLTTLSTPHEGSILADAITGVKSPLYADAYASFWFGFAGMQESALKLGAFNNGYPSLTTALCEEFNRTNLPRLPTRTKFNAVAADADRNGSGTIDIPGEVDGLHSEVSHGFSGHLSVNIPYQVLRTRRAIEFVGNQAVQLPDGSYAPTVTVFGHPYAEPVGNDVLVPIPSGLAERSLGPRLFRRWTLQGSEGRNHSTVANGTVASAVVFPWLFQAEREVGDLR